MLMGIIVVLFSQTCALLSIAYGLSRAGQKLDELIRVLKDGQGKSERSLRGQ
jgi:hypothetical protein